MKKAVGVKVLQLAEKPVGTKAHPNLDKPKKTIAAKSASPGADSFFCKLFWLVTELTAPPNTSKYQYIPLGPASN